MGYLFAPTRRLPTGGWPWPHSRRERRHLLAALTACVEAALAEAAQHLALPRPRPQEPEIERFLCLYAQRPLTSNRHGSGFNDSLWLWLAARWIDPLQISESGTFMGHSAWILRQACPRARIATHDIELWPAGRLRSPDVAYRLDDWAEAAPASVDPHRALCFFDDHISHALRLRQAAAKGYRLALVDDDFPSWQLHATGAPPLPSLSMLLDEDLIASPIEWHRKGKRYAYDAAACSVEEQALIRRLVRGRYRFPDLAPLTRLPPGSNLTLVRLAGNGEDSGEHGSL